MVQPRTAQPAQAATGSIEGRITFTGTPPAPADAGDEGSPPALRVDRTGGVQYAIVFLPDALRAADPPPGAAATVNQRSHVFIPQVIGVRAGQTVRFTNEDPANHNVRVRDASPGNTFSIHTAPGAVGANTHRFIATTGGRPLELSCDIHPWMAAWVFVFEHPHFAVSDADGRFRLDGVPAGRHRIAVRQPAGRLARDLGIDVRAGEITRLDVAFARGDIGMPVR
jgi:plastocyanin